MGSSSSIIPVVMPVDALDRYEQLLSEQEITTLPRTRKLSEDLEHGTTRVLEIIGLLEFQQRQFSYKIEVDRDTCFMTIDVSHGRDVLEAFSAAINRAFPIAKTTASKKSLPKQKIPSDFSLAPFGCILAWIIVSLMCYFTFLGIRSLFFQ